MRGGGRPENKCNTCSGHGTKSSGSHLFIYLFVNSFVAAAIEAPASERINQLQRLHPSVARAQLGTRRTRELLARPLPVLSPITSAHFDCVTYQACCVEGGQGGGIGWMLSFLSGERLV